MSLFLFRFWPALLPIAAYFVWWLRAHRRAHKAGEPKPRFRDGPWYWAVLSSLLIAIGCFIYIAASVEGSKGQYVPPHEENGTLVPGRVAP